MNALRPVFHAVIDPMLKIIRGVATLPLDRLFMVISAAWGLIFMFAVPPFEVPDEDYHFLRSFQIVINGPFSISPAKQIPADAYNFFYNNPYRYPQSTEPSNPKAMVVYNSRGELLSPLIHAPQCLGIGLGWLLQLPIRFIFYLGRLFNLVAWVVSIAYAIRITPVFKKAFFILALLPMAVFLSGSLSYDVAANCIVFLFIAFIFKLTFSDAGLVTKKVVGTLFLFSALIGLAGKANLTLIFLVWLIPFAKMNRFRLFFLWFSMLVTAMIFNLGWIQYASQAHVALAGAVSNPADMFAQLMHQPQHFLGLLYDTLKSTDRQIYYLQSYIGYFGWSDLRLPLYLHGLALLLISWVFITEEPQIRMTTYRRITLFLTGAGGITGIFIIMYLVWTGPASTYIPGVQGRYLIPYIPLILIALLGGRKVSLSILSWRNALRITNFILLISISVLLSEYINPEYPLGKIRPEGYPEAGLVLSAQNNTLITQSFTPICSGMGQVKVLTAPGYFDRGIHLTLDEQVNLAIIDETDQNRIEGQRVSNLTENLGMWMIVNLPRQENSRQHPYQLAISAQDTAEDEPVTILRSREDIYPDGTASIDGIPQLYDLVFLYRCFPSDLSWHLYKIFRE